MHLSGVHLHKQNSSNIVQEMFNLWWIYQVNYILSTLKLTYIAAILIFFLIIHWCVFFVFDNFIIVIVNLRGEMEVNTYVQSNCLFQMSFIFIFLHLASNYFVYLYEINVPLLNPCLAWWILKHPWELPDKLQISFFWNHFMLQYLIHIFSNIHCLFLSAGAVIPTSWPILLCLAIVWIYILLPFATVSLCRDFFICSSQIRVGVRVNICCYNYQFQSVCCITSRCSIPASSNLKFSRLHVYCINFNTLYNR